MNKNSWQVQRSLEISDSERAAAREAILAFGNFIKKLWAARQHDQRLVSVLKKDENTDPSALFAIRHLLRRFQKEVRDRYADLIVSFAGKRDANSVVIMEGCIHSLGALEKDTITRQIKITLQDEMHQLTEYVEEFIEAFEDFNDPEQIKKIINNSKKIDQIAQSIENIVDDQLKPHFERNILKRKRIAEIKGHILVRSRLAKMLVK